MKNASDVADRSLTAFGHAEASLRPAEMPVLNQRNFKQRLTLLAGGACCCDGIAVDDDAAALRHLATERAGDFAEIGLPMIAEKDGEHPWFYKPFACWLHPIKIYFWAGFSAETCTAKRWRVSQR